MDAKRYCASAAGKEEGGYMNPWLLLAFAIAGEVIATTSLRFSQGFTRPVPVVFVVFGYGFAIWLQSLVFKQLPLGTVYAV